MKRLYEAGVGSYAPLMSTPAQPTPPAFDPNAAHQATPRLRPVRGFPVQVQNHQMLGLADARQISDKIAIVPPAAQMILPLLDGSRGLDEIVTQVGHGLTRPILEGLVAQLDDAGLIEGPKFAAMRDKMREDFDANPVLPPSTTASMADALADQAVNKDLAEGEQPRQATEEERAEMGPRLLREIMDQWIDAALKSAPKPSLDELPKAVVAPHLDYQRGWLNYANTYGRMRVVDRPDRVIILGTNHFGEATGVCGCDKGYSTPIGTCEADTAFINELRNNLGAENAGKLFEHRYDHEREHSIELHVPWIQHCLGADEAGNYPKIFGVLIHDPTVRDGESYDGKGLALAPFIDAMKATLAKLPGKTLLVSSADLSHVGQAFGDQQSLAGEDEQIVQARNQVFDHDRQMLQLITDCKTQEFLSAMAWQQNPTRWCSIGNLYATMLLVEPTRVEWFNYAAAMDEQGMALVSSASMAMY